MFKKTIILFSTIIFTCATNCVAFASTLNTSFSGNVENTIVINDEKAITNTVDISTNINENANMDDTTVLNNIIEKTNTKDNTIIETDNTSNTDTADDNSDATNTSATSYKATYSMEATAYTGDTTTKMGLTPVRDPNGLSTIAVDPSIIPLGSKVYIPGYGYAITADTGGAIKGNIIDLFLNSEKECMDWGRRNVTVNVVAYPGEW